MTDQRFAELARHLRPKRPAKPIPEHEYAWANLDPRYGGDPIEDADDG